MVPLAVVTIHECDRRTRTKVS